MTQARYEVLDCTKCRNVYVVGDIHGEFRKLDDALKNLNFDADQGDMVISVGDIVDRGPYSEEFEWWIAQPWFKRVLGNHEDQPGEYLLGWETRENVINNGGQWLVDKPEEEIKRIATFLANAPLAITVMLPSGKQIGITHADTDDNWHLLTQALLVSNPDNRQLLNRLVGSRHIIKHVKKKNPTITETEAYVHGIDHVYHGHTPVSKPITFANRTWIDTKACDGGQLTVINLTTTHQ